MNEEKAKCSTIREPEVAHELSGLSNATGELNEMIDSLKSKLGIVMRDMDEDPKEVDEPEPALCELAGSIKVQKERTLITADRVRRIMARLEI